MSTQSSQPQDDLPGVLPPPSLFQTIQSTDWFICWQKTIKSLETLQYIFNQECPLELTHQCIVAGIKGDCLMLMVENGAIASKLQYRKRELLIALQKYTEFSVLKKILVRVVPTKTVHKEPEPKPSALSPEVAELFKDIAQDIADPELKQALFNFAGIKNDHYTQ